MQYWIMALIGIIFVIWMFRYDKNHPNQIKKSNGKVQKPLHKRWWTWVIAVILIVGGLGNAMGLAADDEDNSASVAQTESKTKNEKSKNKKAVSYTKEQRMPTLQEVANDLCEDNEMEYVTLESKKMQV